MWEILTWKVELLGAFTKNDDQFSCSTCVPAQFTEVSAITTWSCLTLIDGVPLRAPQSKTPSSRGMAIFSRREDLRSRPSFYPLCFLIIVTLALSIGLLVGYKKHKSGSVAPLIETKSLSHRALFVVNGGGSLSVIDVTTDTVNKTVVLKDYKYPRHISLSPDKRKIVVGVPGIDLSIVRCPRMLVNAGKFIVLDSTTCEILKTTEVPNMNRNAVFSPDGSEIWTGQTTTNGTVLVYDSVTYELRHNISVGLMPGSVSFSNDGKKAFVCTGVMNGTVVMINTTSKSIVQIYQVGNNPVGAWPGADNNMYVGNQQSAYISVIDPSNGGNTGTIHLDFTPGMIAYNSVDDNIWITDGKGGEVNVFDSTGSPLECIRTGAGSYGILFIDDYSKVYITNERARTVSVIDTASMKKIKDIKVGLKPNGMALM